MYGFDHGGWMSGGGGAMMIWWLLPIALLIALVVYFVSPSARRNAPAKTALEILKERYARGEIGKEEFEQKKRDVAA